MCQPKKYIHTVYSILFYVNDYELLSAQKKSEQKTLQIAPRLQFRRNHGQPVKRYEFVHKVNFDENIRLVITPVVHGVSQKQKICR